MSNVMRCRTAAALLLAVTLVAGCGKKRVDDNSSSGDSNQSSDEPTDRGQQQTFAKPPEPEVEYSAGGPNKAPTSHYPDLNPDLELSYVGLPGSDLRQRRGIFSFAVSPDRRLIVVHSNEKAEGASDPPAEIAPYARLEVFDFQTGELIKELASRFMAHRVSFSPEGTFIYAEGGYHNLWIWDTSTFEIFRHLESSPDEEVRGKANISVNDAIIISTGSNHYSFINTFSGETVANYPGRGVTVFHAACSPTDQSFILGKLVNGPGSPTGTLTVVTNLPNGETSQHDVQVPSPFPQVIYYSDDGSTVVVGDRNGHLTVYDTGNWQVTHRLLRHEFISQRMIGYRRMTVSENGSHVAALVWENAFQMIELWNIDSGSVQLVGAVPTTDFQFVSDRILCFSPIDGPIRCVDAETNAPCPPPEPKGESAKQSYDAELANLSGVERVRFLRRVSEFEQASLELDQLLSESGGSTSTQDRHDLLVESAVLLRVTGDFEGSLEHLREAFDLAEANLAVSDDEFHDSLKELALTLVQIGRIDEAGEFLNTISASRTERFGADHLAVADVHYVMGRVFAESGDIQNAVESFRQSYELRDGHDECPEADLIASSMWYGTVLSDLELYDQAFPLLSIAYETAQEFYPPEDARRGETALRLHHLYMQMNDPELATSLEAQLPDLDTMYSRSGIYVLFVNAALMASRKEFNQSEAFAQTAIRAIQVEYGSPHPLTAEIYTFMSRVYLASRRFEISEKYARAALEEYQQFLGPEFDQKQELLLLLARTIERQDRHEEAYDIFQQALAMPPSPTPGGRWASVWTRINLGALEIEMDLAEDAKQHFDESMHTLHGALWDVLPHLPDELKYEYLGQFSEAIDTVMTYAMENRYDREWIELSAEWVINLKGMASEQIGRQAALALELENAEDRQLVEQLKQVRRQLAAHANAIQSRTRIRSESDVVKTLSEREAFLTAQLAQRLNINADPPDWVTVDELRNSLDPNSCVVEILKIWQYGVDSSDPTRQVYVAWIIPPAGHGDVTLVRIGSATNIDLAIKEYLTAIDEAMYRLHPSSMIDEMNRFLPLTFTISRHVLQAFEPAVYDYSQWIICPDGMTWFAPWNGFTSLDGRLIVEARTVSSLTSSREIVRERADHPSGPPIVFADPNYDDGNSNIRGIPFSPLPRTREEAMAIKPYLEQLAGADIEMFMGDDAREEVIRQKQSPRALVFSTHGYFDDGEDQLNPLLRCGVALTGANTAFFNARELKEEADSVDGILTGIEAVSLDLRGTELVFLNACETGLGLQHRGEGVSGLHQAFHLAGAEQVISTLWPINDEKAAQVSEYLFQYMAEGHPADVALRMALHQLITDLKREHTVSHPHFFAAFQMTGVTSAQGTQALPETPPDRKGLFLINSMAMPLARIPQGEFVMGTPLSEPLRSDDEVQHTVRIDKQIYMGRYEVTQEEYEYIMGENPSYFSATGNGAEKVAGIDTRRMPVEMVDWNDAVEFCRRLSELPEEKAAGRTYRLPTEAEWEYACRAGSETATYFGDVMGGQFANVNGQFPYGGMPKTTSRDRTIRVGFFPWNGYTLHDTHGNVWEWCQDWYGPYDSNSVVDPQGPDTGEIKVMRGSGFYLAAQYARSGERNAEPPDYKGPNLGFRIVCEVSADTVSP